MSDSYAPVEWRFVAQHWPEFVQWIVQKYGPLPEHVEEEVYNRYAKEYRDWGEPARTVDQAEADRR
jgi:hypothetical protein